MKCPSKLELEMCLDGQATDDDQRAVETHITQCSQCRDVWEGLLGENDSFGQRIVAALQVGAQSHNYSVGWLDRLAARPPRSQHGDRQSTFDAAARFTFPEAATILGPLGKFDKYHIAELLGWGGFGAVFRAKDERLDRWVALKVLMPPEAHQLGSGSDDCSWDERRNRFGREARLASQVKDEHVVDIRHVGTFLSGLDGQEIPFLEMEFLAGGTLAQRLKGKPDWGFPEIAEIGRQIALGLGAAHARKVIHRDVKPGNVLFDSETKDSADFGPTSEGHRPGLASADLNA